VNWARDRFEVDLDLDDLKSKQRDEIHQVLLQHSKTDQQRVQDASAAVQKKLDSIFPPDSNGTLAGSVSNNGALDSLSDWSKQTLHLELPKSEISELNRESLEQKL
jgi:preprotein translocase subunit SecA